MKQSEADNLMRASAVAGMIGGQVFEIRQRGKLFRYFAARPERARAAAAEFMALEAPGELWTLWTLDGTKAPE